MALQRHIIVHYYFKALLLLSYRVPWSDWYARLRDSGHAPSDVRNVSRLTTKVYDQARSGMQRFVLHVLPLILGEHQYYSFQMFCISLQITMYKTKKIMCMVRA